MRAEDARVGDKESPEVAMKGAAAELGHMKGRLDKLSEENSWSIRSRAPQHGQRDATHVHSLRSMRLLGVALIQSRRRAGKHREKI